MADTCHYGEKIFNLTGTHTVSFQCSMPRKARMGGGSMHRVGGHCSQRRLAHAFPCTMTCAAQHHVAPLCGVACGLDQLGSEGPKANVVPMPAPAGPKAETVFACRHHTGVALPARHDIDKKKKIKRGFTQTWQRGLGRGMPTFSVSQWIELQSSSQLQ